METPAIQGSQDTRCTKKGADEAINGKSYSGLPTAQRETETLTAVEAVDASSPETTVSPHNTTSKQHQSD